MQIKIFFHSKTNLINLHLNLEDFGTRFFVLSISKTTDTITLILTTIVSSQKSTNTFPPIYNMYSPYSRRMSGYSFLFEVKSTIVTFNQ